MPELKGLSAKDMDVYEPFGMDVSFVRVSARHIFYLLYSNVRNVLFVLVVDVRLCR